MGWQDDMYKNHSKYMEEKIENLMDQGKSESKYLTIFFGVAVIVGILFTILYFTKWKKESYEDEEHKV